MIRNAAASWPSATTAVPATAIPGVASARGRLAVPLTDFGLRSYIAGRVPNRPELLARWIADPRSLVPDTAMPDMGVTDDDARDIAAYLGRLR